MARVLLIALALACLMVASGSTLHTVRTEAQTPVTPPPGSKAALPPSKMTNTLQHLADLAATGGLAAPGAARSTQAGLKATGAGSLAQNATGQINVEVGVNDTSPATVNALSRFGTVINVSQQYRKIAMFVDPTQLDG